MTSKIQRLSVLSTAIVAFLPHLAFAAIKDERKLGQFGSPIEWRTTCVKWASGKWPWSTKGGWKTCVGHKYENLQHEFFLILSGPDIDQAAKQVLQEALGVAAAAAVAAGLLTPSPEPIGRIAAALTAAKTAFMGYLAARGLERLTMQYKLKIDHRTHW
jgi:hypothetical protein